MQTERASQGKICLSKLLLMHCWAQGPLTKTDTLTNTHTHTHTHTHSHTTSLSVDPADRSLTHIYSTCIISRILTYILAYIFNLILHSFSHFRSQANLFIRQNSL